MKKLFVLFLMALLPAYALAITPPGSTADAQINGDVAQATTRTQGVFKQMGIKAVGSHLENHGDKQTLKGKKGQLNIEVSLEKAEEAKNQTEVEVTAKKDGALNWDNDYAKKVLENIIASS